GGRRLEALARELRQDGHEGRGHRLVVDRAARGEKAVALLQDEGVGLPIRAQRLDHVQVSEQEQGLLAAVAPEASDQVALPGERLEDLHVGLGKPRLPEMPGHALRGERGVAGRMRGIRFNQLLVDGVKALLLRAERLGCRGEGNRADREGADGCLPVHVRSFQLTPSTRRTSRSAALPSTRSASWSPGPPCAARARATLSKSTTTAPSFTPF